LGEAKGFKKGGGGEQQASRGSSVLTDTIRWQAFLSGMSESEGQHIGLSDDERKKYVRFGISNKNYGEPLKSRWFKRAAHGVFRPLPACRRVIAPPVPPANPKNPKGDLKKQNEAYRKHP
jgi:hypothetical protein